jgi:hypothetical protein
MDDVATTARATDPAVANGKAPLPPVRSGPGLRPALIVLGIAVVLVVGFSIGELLSGGPAKPGPAAPSVPTKVKGTSLLAVSGRAALRPIEGPGEPPGNILRAVALPDGACRVSAEPDDGGGQYDAQVQFSMPASQGSVIDFYRAEVPALGWQVFSTGSAFDRPGSVEVLAKKAGDDGWYWEMGVVVSPTTFGSSSGGSCGGSSTGGQSTGAAGAAGGGDTTRFTLRLFQVSDQD